MGAGSLSGGFSPMRITGAPRAGDDHLFGSR